MSRRLLFRKACLYLTLVFMVAFWCSPAAAYTLEVRAWVDGISQLVIQGKNVQWHNLQSRVPGYEEQDPPGLPTYLKTRNMGEVAWTPAWSGGTNGDQWSSKFTALKPVLPGVEQEVHLKEIAVRPGGHVSIVEGPSAANGYQLIVEFDDDAPGGAFWYEIGLDFSPNLAWTASMSQGVGDYSSANAVAVSGNTLYVAGHIYTPATHEDFRLQTLDAKTGAAGGQYTTGVDSGTQDSFKLITPGKNKAFVGGTSTNGSDLSKLYCFSPSGGTLPWGPQTFERWLNGVVNVSKQVIASLYHVPWLVEAFDETTGDFLWEDRRGPTPWYATKGHRRGQEGGLCGRLGGPGWGRWQ